MGAWTYYTASMRLDEVATRVSLAQDIHHSRALSEMIQRAVTNRSRDIARYLIQHPEDRFFNALVIGVYRGEPEWHDIDIKANPYLDDEEIERLDGQLGAFVLNGGEQLYAIDGQHRVVGIQRALLENPELGADNIVVTFVPYETNTNTALQRTRRLFTTLNRYAKPVSPRDRIALDEDDAVAIITRKLIEQYPLFQNDKISSAHTKALPVANRTAVTTVVALYDVMDVYLRTKEAIWANSGLRSWSRFKRLRADDTVLDALYREAAVFWDASRVAFEELDAVAISEPGDDTAGRYRTRDGGHLLFRPVGMRALVRGAVAFDRIRVRLDRAMARLASVPVDLAAPPWAGVLYDTVTRRMRTDKSNQEVAFALWFYLAGGPLSEIKLDEERLKEMIAGVTARQVSEVSLPQPIASPVNARMAPSRRKRATGG